MALLPLFCVKMSPQGCQVHNKNLHSRRKVSLTMVQGQGSVTLTQLSDVVVVEFGPLEDVLLTHNVRVDEQVAVTHAEVLLTRRALEALQMVNLVPHAHGHLKRSDPLFTGSTQTILTEKPEEGELVNTVLRGRWETFTKQSHIMC